MWQATQRIHTARNRLRRSEIYKGKKETVHCIRYLLFAIQIAKYEKIVDFTVANSLLEEVMSDQSTDWENLVAKSINKIGELKDELKQTAKIYKFYGRTETHRMSLDFLKRLKMKAQKSANQFHREKSSPTVPVMERIPSIHQSKSQCKTQKLLKFLDKDTGLHYFNASLQILTTQHPQYPNLVHFICVVWECRFSLLIFSGAKLFV